MDMVAQDQSLHILQEVIDGLDVGKCQLKVSDVGLGGSCWDHHPHAMVRTVLPYP